MNWFWLWLYNLSRKHVKTNDLDYMDSIFRRISDIHKLGLIKYK